MRPAVTEQTRLLMQITDYGDSRCCWKTAPADRRRRRLHGRCGVVGVPVRGALNESRAASTVRGVQRGSRPPTELPACQLTAPSGQRATLNPAAFNNLTSCGSHRRPLRGCGARVARRHRVLAGGNQVVRSVSGTSASFEMLLPLRAGHSRLPFFGRPSWADGWRRRYTVRAGDECSRQGWALKANPMTSPWWAAVPATMA